MRKNGTGPFVACTNYPDCDYIRGEVFPDENSDESLLDNKILGKDNGIEVLLKKGPYGPYVQLGSDEEDKKKLKRASIPKNINVSEIDLSLAKKLLALPREVGEHPETGEVIVANNGRYGPYLKYKGTFYSIPKDENPLTIGINRAVDILWTFRNIDLEEVVKLTTPVDYLTLNDGRQVLVLKQSINTFLKEKSILDS